MPNITNKQLKFIVGKLCELCGFRELARENNDTHFALETKDSSIDEQQCIQITLDYNTNDIFIKFSVGTAVKTCRARTIEELNSHVGNYREEFQKLRHP